MIIKIGTELATKVVIKNKNGDVLQHCTYFNTETKEAFVYATLSYKDKDGKVVSGTIYNADDVEQPLCFGVVLKDHTAFNMETGEEIK